MEFNEMPAISPKIELLEEHIDIGNDSDTTSNNTEGQKYKYAHNGPKILGKYFNKFSEFRDIKY